MYSSDVILLLRCLTVFLFWRPTFDRETTKLFAIYSQRANKTGIDPYGAIFNKRHLNILNKISLFEFEYALGVKQQLLLKNFRKLQIAGQESKKYYSIEPTLKTSIKIFHILQKIDVIQYSILYISLKVWDIEYNVEARARALQHCVCVCVFVCVFCLCVCVCVP